MFESREGRFVRVPPNASGRVPFTAFQVEFGVWRGEFADIVAPWLRVWDAATGELLPCEAERSQREARQAAVERARANAAQARAEEAESLITEFRHIATEEAERARAERDRADRLAAKLRELGIDPEAA